MEYDKKKKFKKRIIKGIALLIVIGTSFVVGNVAFRHGIIIGKNRSEYKYAMSMAEKYPEFITLFEVRNDIDKLYDGEIDSDLLVENATKAMTEALGDQYTVYMNKEEFGDYLSAGCGYHSGIGVYVKSDNEKVVVIGFVDGGTAKDADVKIGDVIKAVDGVEVGKDLEKAVSLISGKEGTTVKLELEREGVGAVTTEVKRVKLETTSAAGKMVTDNIGYISLINFNSGSGAQFSEQLDKLSQEGMKGLIIDLRNNGGGYLTEAINIASEFIPKGKTVTYTIDKYDKKEVRESTGEDVLDIPVTILVNEYSASASEVVTGALRDYDIAETVGVTTFGKGVVQEVFQLEKGKGGLKVTVSKYYTPNGENINKKGIKPTYEVELSDGVTSKDYLTESDNQFAEAIKVTQEKIK